MFDFFLNNFSLALDFRSFLENMKMSLLSKILERGKNVFKCNSQIIKKNIMKYQLYTNDCYTVVISE